MISRVFRTIATIIAYTIFFVGSLVQGVVVYFFLVVFIRNANVRKKILRKSVSYSFKFFLSLCSFLHVFRVHFSDFKDVNSEGARLVIANHPTLVDYVILTSKLSAANNTMVKFSLTKGFMGPVIKHLGYVNNQSPYEEILQSKDHNEHITIFPEGTRTKDSSAFKFQRGVANISSRLNIDIYPIFIYCDTKGYLSNKFLSLKVPLKMPHIYVEIGEKIAHQLFTKDNEPPSKVARHLNQFLEDMYNKKIQEMREQYSLKDE